MLLSVPIAGFCAWFGYRAFKVGKRDTAITFGVMAFASLLVAVGGGGWLLMLLTSR